MARIFPGMSLREAMGLVPTEDMKLWNIDAAPRLPSGYLQEALLRFAMFDLKNTEAAKILLIDALLVEIVPTYRNIKVFKGAMLESETLTGVADYLVAPNRAFVRTPLLCAVEAKRDDFTGGQAQCIAEMVACRDNNRRDGHALDIYGIVSNGQAWEFYRLTITNEVWQSELYTTGDLPRLLGAINFVVASCAENVPAD